MGAAEILPRFCGQIPFDKSNVATFATSSGCENFRTFQACLEAADESGDEVGFTAFDATLIVDDEDDEQSPGTRSNDEVDETHQSSRYGKPSARRIIHMTTTLVTQRQQEITTRHTTSTRQ